VAARLARDKLFQQDACASRLARDLVVVGGRDRPPEEISEPTLRRLSQRRFSELGGRRRGPPRPCGSRRLLQRLSDCLVRRLSRRVQMARALLDVGNDRRQATVDCPCSARLEHSAHGFGEERMREAQAAALELDETGLERRG
jgi:hypothetical protein